MAAINTPAPAGSVSVEEYIARYVNGNEKPACEYINGDLIPKSVGTKPHSKVQMNIAYAIRSRWSEKFDPLPELTTRLEKKRFYIPDVAVEEKAKPISGRYPGPAEPVFLCVEVLSPPDRLGRLFAKCEEYHRWGVPYCWVVDPERRKAWEYMPRDEEPRLAEKELTAGPISLSLAEVFEGV